MGPLLHRPDINENPTHLSFTARFLFDSGRASTLYIVRDRYLLSALV